MDERKMFEAWIDSREGSSLRSGFDGSLDYPLGNIMWEVWQAARRTTPDREAFQFEATPMKPGQFGGTEPVWRMDAYYYGFFPTGVAIVDRILSAVACAGKSFHHTDNWTDHCSPYENLRGETATDWIQNAANDAAEFLKTGAAIKKTAHEIVADQRRTHEFVQFADRTQYIGSIDPNGGIKTAPTSDKGGA